jgi:hypothetical protein
MIARAAPALVALAAVVGDAPAADPKPFPGTPTR